MPSKLIPTHTKRELSTAHCIFCSSARQLETGHGISILFLSSVLDTNSTYLFRLAINIATSTFLFQWAVIYTALVLASSISSQALTVVENPKKTLVIYPVQVSISDTTLFSPPAVLCPYQTHPLRLELYRQGPWSLPAANRPSHLRFHPRSRTPPLSTR